MRRGRIFCMLLILIFFSERIAQECHFYQNFSNVTIAGIVVAEYGVTDLRAVNGYVDLIQICNEAMTSSILENVSDIWSGQKNDNSMGCLLVDCDALVDTSICPALDKLSSGTKDSHIPSISLHIINESCISNPSRETYQFIGDMVQKFNCCWSEHGTVFINTIKICDLEELQCNFKNNDKPDSKCISSMLFDIAIKDLVSCEVSLLYLQLRRMCKYSLNTLSPNAVIKHIDIEESLNLTCQSSNDIGSTRTRMINVLGYSVENARSASDTSFVLCENDQNKYRIEFSNSTVKLNTSGDKSNDQFSQSCYDPLTTKSNELFTNAEIGAETTSHTTMLTESYSTVSRTETGEFNVAVFNEESRMTTTNAPASMTSPQKGDSTRSRGFMMEISAISYLQKSTVSRSGEKSEPSEGPSGSNNMLSIIALVLAILFSLGTCLVLVGRRVYIQRKGNEPTSNRQDADTTVIFGNTIAMNNLSCPPSHPQVEDDTRNLKRQRSVRSNVTEFNGGLLNEHSSREQRMLPQAPLCSDCLGHSRKDNCNACHTRAMSACSYRTTDCRYEDTAVNENHMNNGKRISLFESSESIYFTIEDRELQRRSVTNDPAADDIVSISAMKNLSKTSSQFSPAPRCPCKQDNVATHMTKFEDASCDKHSDQSHGMFPSRSKQSSKSQESMSMFLRHEDTRSKEELQEENKNELNSIENACVCHSSESLYFTIDDVDDDECKPRTVENLNSQCGVKSVDNLYAKAGRGEICTNQSSIPPEQPKISETRTADSMSSVGAKHVHSAVDINAPSTESLYEISTLAVSSVDLANDHDAWR